MAGHLQRLCDKRFILSVEYYSVSATAKYLVAAMKKIKNENALFKEAIRVGTIYLQKRGVANFDATDDINFKAKAIYTLLVLDKLIQPLPKQHEDSQNIRHKLAIWISKRLPQGHELLR